MKPLISIIIPIYNTEQYLPKCLASILAQSYCNFEVLMIDDGSNDNSGEICDEYVSKDSRFVVFHNKNSGPAFARQIGFQHASGEYITSIDSDDWVDSDYLLNMVNQIQSNNADLVMTAFFENNGETSIYMANAPSSNQPADWQCDFLRGICHAGLWNKLLKRSILIRLESLMPKHNFFEDMFIIISYLNHCDIIVYDDRAQYHYRNNPSSLTRDKQVGTRKMMLSELLLNLYDLNEMSKNSGHEYLCESICFRVNKEKLYMIEHYYSHYKEYKDIICTIFPNAYPFSFVRGYSTFARFCALKGYIMPYKLLLKFRQTIQCREA